MDCPDTTPEQAAAREAARAGFYPTTVALLERMRSTRELDASMLALLARAYLETGKREAALACVEQLRQSMGEDPGPEVRLLLERLREPRRG